MYFVEVTDELNDHQRADVRQILSKYEQAKITDPNVEIADYLPKADNQLRSQILQGLIATDLALQWRRNQPVLLENYLEAFPEITSVYGVSPFLVFEEYRIRQQHGDHPELTTYRARFPAQFDKLEQLIDSMGRNTKFGDVHTTPVPTTNRGDVVQVGPGDGYKLISRLGDGNFGEVWKAKTAGGMVVAVKIITWPLDHPATQRELTSLDLIKVKEIRHPFLLAIQAFHEMDDRLVIVMNLADCSLRDRLDQVRTQGDHGIPSKELLPYMRETAEALDYLHSMNVQHRDIKPENLLLMRGHIQVADLGLARLLDPQHQVNVSILGTPLYMAPEVWQGKMHTNSDQYGLAISYLELRCGKCPFQSANTDGLLAKHLAEHPEFAMLPAAEKEVLLRAGACDPMDRYSTCSEFVVELEKALEPGGSLAYQKIEYIGKGSLGEVWRGEAPGGIPVAIKVIPFANKGKGQKELRGLDLIKTHSHPHLVKIHAYWFEDEDLHIAMELADSDLRDRLQQHQQRGATSIPANELVKYTQQAAAALDFLHQNRVIHRDIKPENILLSSDYVKVADFSLACVLRGQSVFDATTAGTMHYMAPEIWQGKATHQSDQYSLAATYFELRTGRPLFPVKSIAESAECHLRTVPDLTPLPQAEQFALHKALAKTPNERFESCVAFANELARALGEETLLHMKFAQAAGEQLKPSLLAAEIPQPATIPPPHGQSTHEPFNKNSDPEVQGFGTLQPPDKSIATEPVLDRLAQNQPTDVKPEKRRETNTLTAGTVVNPQTSRPSVSAYSSAAEPATVIEPAPARSKTFGNLIGLLILFILACIPLTILVVKLTASDPNGAANTPAIQEEIEELPE